MKILIIGGGGREHALAWKISQSKKVNKIYCAPGNGGISAIAECVDIEASNIKDLAEFALKNKIDITIIGPEIPLVNGVTGEFERRNLKVFGPSQPASEIEGSKIFAKNFMKAYDIPTASYEVFEDSEKAVDYLKSQKYPAVIKADGLAAGKGVIIASDFSEAKKAVNEIMKAKIFGDAGNNIVIEEYIDGEEATVLAFSDGKTVIPLMSSQDHKRAYDGDLGPNTGGMGAYAPAPVVTDDILLKIKKDILIPTIKGMNEKGRKYKGILYAGLMITKEGPKVIEYNCRFGDPETQAVLPLLEEDLVDIMEAVIFEELHTVDMKWSSKNTITVVLASEGYPGKYKKGIEIQGIDLAEKIEDVVVFHSGTVNFDGRFITTGGRVLNVTAVGNTLKEAIVKAYLAINKIKFEGMQFRKDIGYKAFKKFGI